MNKLAKALLLGSVLLPSVAQAVELRLSSVAPDGTIWHQQMTDYIAKVNELSGGDIKIEYFGGGQLGNNADTLNMVMSGRLDIWFGPSPNMAAITPEISLWSLPYLFESAEEAKCVGPRLVDPARELIGDKYHLAGIISVGSQSLGLKEEAHRPEDIAGIKLRTAPLKTTLTFFDGIGANPVPLAAAETSAALNTGLVDGVDFTPSFYMASGSAKLAPVFVPTEHTYNIGGFAISSRAWNGLSDEQKAIMDEAFAATLSFPNLVQQVADDEQKAIDKHLENGGSVVALSDEDKSAWQTAGRASWDAVLADLRGDADGYLQVINDAKAACAN